VIREASQESSQEQEEISGDTYTIKGGEKSNIKGGRRGVEVDIPSNMRS